MDALRGLTEGQGCAVDGTAAGANPLAQLVNQTLGMGQKGGAAGPMGPGQFVPPPGAMHGQASEVERGMNAAMAGQRARFAGPMGAAAGPAGVMGRGMAGPMSGPAMPGAATGFVQEFEQQFRGDPGMAMGMGPRGHPGMHAGEQWVRDFQQMSLGNPMERAYRQNFGWAHEMARGPTPAQLEMERVWRQQQQADGNAWAKELAAKPPPAQQQEVRSLLSLALSRARVSRSAPKRSVT